MSFVIFKGVLSVVWVSFVLFRVLCVQYQKDN